MTAGKLRLFLAASVPPDRLEHVAEQTGELRSRWERARWTPVENQHLTLKFLGSTPPEVVDAICSSCDGVARATAPASVGLDRFGAFPSPKRARVLWVGVDDPAGVLGAIARALDRRLERLGFPPEKRPYSPHVTVARFREPVSLGPLPSLDPAAPFEVESFGLWRSQLSPRGARYERIATFRLGAAADAL